MENNLKNKAKFFAQYWDQKILTGIPVDKPFTFRRLNHQNIQKGIMYSFLKLKSLSDITDEDAIEVAKIIDYNHGRNKLAFVKVGKHVCHNILEMGEITPKRAFSLIDYLRSKGYALPYNGLSVENQISYGWVKLRTNE